MPRQPVAQAAFWSPLVNKYQEIYLCNFLNFKQTNNFFEQNYYVDYEMKRKKNQKKKKMAVIFLSSFRLDSVGRAGPSCERAESRKETRRFDGVENVA